MTDSASYQAVVCRAGARRFALSLNDVREVCTDVPIVRMPGVAAPVEGVANVRGSVITVVRAAELLGELAGDSGQSPWLVVLRYRDGKVALGVDEVDDLGSVDGSMTLLDVGAELAPLFDRAS